LVTGFKKSKEYGMKKTAATLCVLTAIALLTVQCSKNSMNDTYEAITNDTLSTADYTLKRIPGGANGTAGVAFPTGEYDTTSSKIYKDFWLADSETTYALWKKVYDWATDAARGSKLYSIAHIGQKGTNTTGSDLQPVVYVSWRDAVVWCNALTEYSNANSGTNYSCVYYTDSTYNTPLRSSSTSTTIQYNTAGSEDDPYIKATANNNTSIANCTATGFRLPTSDEWEFASRYRGTDNTNTVAGYSNPYFTKGDSLSGATYDYTNNAACFDVAVFKTYHDTTLTGVTTTAVVKSKTKNKLGLYDMSGNVFEWCFDPHPDYPTTDRIGRSSSFAQQTDFMMQGYVSSNYPYATLNVTGFRFARQD
jgi:formylglycine-generating enzyme